jgi:putative hydroxymethylpyrimidine transport system permease protein
MTRVLHFFGTLAVLLGLWTLAYYAAGQQSYLLPSPWQTIETLIRKGPYLVQHGLITGGEIVLGLIFGTLTGCGSALLLATFTPLRRWVVPVLVLSQAIPVFAIAPLLVLWLGYGTPSKVAMATLIIYFPITTTFLDGLRHTDRGWLDLAQVMGGTRWRVMWHLRVPAALPHLASGLRVAAAVAPIGAVIGEWVGSAQGLGFVMIQANARVQVDVMFAALLMLALVAIVLYVTTDFLLRRLLPWVPGNERAASAD